MNLKFASTLASYNQHAAQFVQHFEKKLDPTELDEFLALLPKAAFILDAGCGSARDAAYFIKQGRKAVGIDVSAGLLTEAHKLHPEVPTQVMDLLEITFPDQTFDGIWCKATLLHIERKDIPQIFDSFHRILKENGHLFIQTKAGKGEGTQPVPFDPSMSRYFAFYELPEIEALLTQAKFRIIKKYDFNGKLRSTNSRDQDWIVVFAQKI
jgi:ubiquinone/menaquinone biosynthesis C-methylase UbiE